MGIYLDNDTIYDRGYRYLAGLPQREDDLPIGNSQPVIIKQTKESDSKYDYSVRWREGGGQYFSDEVLKYYIYKNGQCQETCRDHPHCMAGIGNYICIAEMAWNQGDSLYSWLDNRILLGMEYMFRYNLSYLKSYPDQTKPWEPTGFSENENECTFENGLFYQALSRSKRWKAKAPDTHSRGKVVPPGGWKTQVLEHYKVRAGLSQDKMLWSQRAYDIMMDEQGYEGWGQAPNWYYEWCGWGTLTKKRTEWMAGDAGTWQEGVRISGIPSAPCVIKAVDYDYYAEDGESHTYHNIGENRNSGLYRSEGAIEIAEDSGEFSDTKMKNGEWMNYTVIFPAPVKCNQGIEKVYKIYVTYKASKSGSSLSVSVDDAVSVSAELQSTYSWKELLLGSVKVKCGASVIRLYVEGDNDIIDLKNIRVE